MNKNILKNYTNYNSIDKKFKIVRSKIVIGVRTRLLMCVSF